MMLSSFFGYIFEGCWHDYGDWSDPDWNARSVFQFKECSKCGKVKVRTLQKRAISKGYSAKPKKPNSLPDTSSTPKPPTGGTGESSKKN